MKNPYTTIFRVIVASTVSNPMGGCTVSSVTGLVIEPKPNLATAWEKPCDTTKKRYTYGTFANRMLRSLVFLVKI